MASQTITLAGGWQSLGTGPLKLQPHSSGGVWIIAAATQPSGVAGDYYLNPGQSGNFESSDTYWALPDSAGLLLGVETISLGSGGGGGGGAVTIADGANIAQGATTDAAYVSGAGTGIALLKGIFGKLGATVLAAGSAIIGKVGIDQTTPGATNGVIINAPLASGVAPITGTFVATGQSAGFTPKAGRSFNISLWGTFSATVQLERSFDGTNWLPITANGTQLLKFTGPVSEQWSDDEVGAQYRLNCTSYTSGTVNYRISQ